MMPDGCDGETGRAPDSDEHAPVEKQEEWTRDRWSDGRLSAAVDGGTAVNDRTRECNAEEKPREIIGGQQAAKCGNSMHVRPQICKR
jgi:hypothetical protein